MRGRSNSRRSRAGRPLRRDDAVRSDGARRGARRVVAGPGHPGRRPGRREAGLRLLAPPSHHGPRGGGDRDGVRSPHGKHRSETDGQVHAPDARADRAGHAGPGPRRGFRAPGLRARHERLPLALGDRNRVRRRSEAQMASRNEVVRGRAPLQPRTDADGPERRDVVRGRRRRHNGQRNERRAREPRLRVGHEGLAEQVDPPRDEAAMGPVPRAHCGVPVLQGVLPERH